MKKILSQQAKDALLLLDQSENIGAKTLQRVVHHYRSDPARVLTDSEKNLVKFFTETGARNILEARRGSVNKKIFAQYDIKLVFRGDKEYPKLLEEIYDPPMILYCRGNVDLLDSLSLAIVGSRKHTTYSKSVLEKIIPSLVSSKLVIVSGLALGVDSLAHYLTLENGGQTIGVLGCGVDKVYPVANIALGERIIKSGGLIISEFPPETPPYKSNFPIRNRVIAGISAGTLIVEARFDSGSLITAGLANDFGHEVFAVPGNIDSFASEGANALIKQGASIVTSAEDILQAFNIDSQTAGNIILEPSSKEESLIFAALDREALSVDKIAKATNLDIVAINSLMSVLEISGKVEKAPDGFKLKGRLK